MIITEQEIQAARYCLQKAQQKGASAVRVTLNKATSDIYSLLNGELDKVTHASDCGLFLAVGVKGSHASFSTNRLGEKELDRFVAKAVESASCLEEDPLWKLPHPSRCCREAIEGNELGLCDKEYFSLTEKERLERAMQCAPEHKQESDKWKIISEEAEYGDSVEEEYMIDSQGLECHHSESAVDCGCEVTLEDDMGEKHSGHFWKGSLKMNDLDPGEISRTALQRAIRLIGPREMEGGNRKMVVDREVASRLLTPVLNALHGSALQQRNSFLCDSLGKNIFGNGMTVKDFALTHGCPGSRLYDSEGVATKDRTVISNGTINTYYLTTYYAGKMDMEPTVDGPSRIVMEPWNSMGENKLLDLQDILEICGDGVYVTGFNGGNCNSVTGDFSYGVRGFEIKGGKLARPFSTMLVTGNMKDLWNSLTAVGNDAVTYSRWQIPTLAFSDAIFSA